MTSIDSIDQPSKDEGGSHGERQERSADGGAEAPSGRGRPRGGGDVPAPPGAGRLHRGAGVRWGERTAKGGRGPTRPGVPGPAAAQDGRPGAAASAPCLRGHPLPAGCDPDLLFQRDPGTQPGIRQVLTPAEAYLITDTLKDYQRVWGLGWNRQMAGKSGTTGGSATGVHRDAWMMAYNPDIVVGAWTGHTQPPGVNANDSISTFGTQVGQTVLRTFINGLPGTMRDWYRQPAGIVRGSGCPGQGSSGEIFLAGTQEDVSCPTPTPTPTPR